MIDVIAGVLLVSGALLALTAAIGLVRFPDVLTRMHAATKPQTLGLLLILLGAALRIREAGPVAMIAVVAIFQLLTAPVSAHMVGRAAFRTGQFDASRLVVDELTEDRERDGA